MYEESALRKWFSREARRINEGIVDPRIPLRDLLEMERPVGFTRGGQEYAFDKAVLGEIASRLPRDLWRKLRLPVVFHYDMDVPSSCSLSDSTALEALQELGELSRERVMVGGKVFVGRAIVFSIMRTYPTAFQIMVG
ncbi:MAG: DUF61 family protein [Methanolinea sp.]|nr:DUF61 family protein [Methanolinea sp.]